MTEVKPEDVKPENEDQKETVEYREEDMKPEDIPLFDSLWRYMEESKEARITVEYLNALIKDRLASLRKNVVGVEKILSDKYPSINFNGNFELRDGKVIQKVIVRDTIEKLEEDKKADEKPEE